ncbi:major outer sheath protein Msp [Treponema phagedenis]|uniref:major outer sheath protein Msp n=1 Tax=Treponema phagedenis TaxID=162 RepID=UPI00159F913E|nr:MSP porin [Treponema phagedenis]NVP24840.1 MSP porin [Treponema phagedenis]QLC59019.1 MSP porin [Treponema phagedenis]
MKKYLIAFSIFAFALGIAFAQEAEAAEPAQKAAAAEPAQKAAAAEPAKEPEVYALTSGAKASIEGSTKLEWGIDLGAGKVTKDSIAHGFKNSGSWKVSFPLFEKKSFTSKADTPVYAEVIIKDVELGIQSKNKSKKEKDFAFTGKVDEIVGTLYFYDAYLKIYKKPGFKVNYAQIWDPLKADDWDKSGYKFEPGFDIAGGTTLGYKKDNIGNSGLDLDAGVKFGSNGNWETEGKSDYEGSPQYALITGPATLAKGSTYVELEPVYGKEAEEKASYIMLDNQRFKITSNFKKVSPDKDLEVKEGKYYAKVDGLTKKDTPATKNRYGMGFYTSVAYKPGDLKYIGFNFDINTTFCSHKDWENNTEKGNYFNVSFGTKITSEPVKDLSLVLAFDGEPFVNGEKKFAWDMLFDTTYKWVGAGVYVGNENTFYKSNKDEVDMSIYAKFETKGDKKKANFLVENLNAGAAIYVHHLLSKPVSPKTVPIGLKVYADYKYDINDSMWLKPYASFYGETNHAEPKFGVYYNVGLTFSPLERLELTADWEQGKVVKNKHEGFIEKSAGKEHNGRFKLGCKVSF